MSAPSEDSLMQNLAVAVVIAILGLFVGIASLMAESRIRQVESAVVASLAGEVPTGFPQVRMDPAFRRIWCIELKGAPRYASIAQIGRQGASIQVAFLFGRKGELEGFSVVGGGDHVQPWSKNGFFAPFLGKGANVAYKVPAGASADSDERAALSTSIAVLTRLSAAVRDVAGGSQR